jgi:hypothetical protein
MLGKSKETFDSNIIFVCAAHTIHSGIWRLSTPVFEGVTQFLDCSALIFEILKEVPSEIRLLPMCLVIVCRRGMPRYPWRLKQM